MSSDQQSPGGGTRPANRWSPGAQPTGSELSSEGSSVITDSDVATAEDIPDVEEIFDRADRVGKGEPHPRTDSAGGKTVDETEQPSDAKRKPHEMYEEGAWLEGE